jgi:hypothetical protein
MDVGASRTRTLAGLGTERPAARPEGQIHLAKKASADNVAAHDCEYSSKPAGPARRRIRGDCGRRSGDARGWWRHARDAAGPRPPSGIWPESLRATADSWPASRVHGRPPRRRSPERAPLVLSSGVRVGPADGTAKEDDDAHARQLPGDPLWRFGIRQIARGGFSRDEAGLGRPAARWSSPAQPSDSAAPGHLCPAHASERGSRLRRHEISPVDSDRTVATGVASSPSAPSRAEPSATDGASPRPLPATCRCSANWIRQGAGRDAHAGRRWSGHDARSPPSTAPRGSG